jgi:hypothetical protein
MDGRYKYIRTLVEDETEELYDLKLDPEELTNLAWSPNELERLRGMRQATIIELNRNGAGLVNSLPPYSSPE